MTDDLMRRLERRKTVFRVGGSVHQLVNPDGTEAAARIRELEAERDAALANLEALGQMFDVAYADRSVTPDSIEYGDWPDWLAADMPLAPALPAVARIRELEAERDAALAAHDRIARAAYELAAEAARDWFYDPEADAVTDERLAAAIRAIDPDEAIKRAKEVGE